MNSEVYPSQSAVHFFYLLMKAALVPIEPFEKPANVSWEEILRFAEHNSLEGLLYYGLQKCKSEITEDLETRWRGRLYSTIYHNLAMSRSRDLLYEQLEILGIDYLPIKGAVIEASYPEPGMRSMSDSDILYRFENDEERGLSSRSRKQLQLLADISDFSIVSSGGTVDVVTDSNGYFFEMHRDFLGSDQPLHDYYHVIWNQAVNDGKPHKYRLTDSEQFLLNLVHAAKHYYSEGFGPKCIVDLYVLENNPDTVLDRNWIKDRLAEFQLLEFVSDLKKLADIVFQDAAGSENDWKKLAHFMQAGTYGSVEQRIENDLQRTGKQGASAKFEYLKKRFVLDESFIRDQFPFFYRHKSLRPVLLLYRIGRSILFRFPSLKEELKILMKLK